MSKEPIDNPVGRYLMTEPSGSLVCKDSSKFKVDGDFVAGHTRDSTNKPPIDGEIPGTKDFDGLNDRILLRNTNGTGRIVNDFTVCYWMYWATQTNSHSPFSAMSTDGDEDNELTLFTKTDGDTGNNLYNRWWINGTAINSAVEGNKFFENEWTFCGIRRSGSALYEISNTNILSLGTNGNALNLDCQMFIGLDADTSCISSLANVHVGGLYDMRFYDVALSDRDWLRLANGYQDPQTDNVVPHVTDRLL